MSLPTGSPRPLVAEPITTSPPGGSSEPSRQRVVGSQTLADITRRSAGRYPGKTALIDGAVRVTFAELDHLVDATAAAIQAEGLVKGDVVAVLSRNCWQLAVLPFAAARAGVILAPINFLLSPSEVAAILRLAKPKAFIAEEHLIDTAQAALDQIKADSSAAHPNAADPDASDRPAGEPTTAPGDFNAITRLGIGPDKRAARHGWRDLDEWLNHPGRPTPAPLADHDIVRLMFTSGTEAGAKAVQLTSRSLMWQYISTIVSGGAAVEDVDLQFMPFYHCAQLDVFLIPDIYLGATSVVLRSAGPGPIMRAIEEHGVNKMFATPSKWIELLHSPAFDPDRLKGLTKGYYGASAMPVPVLRELAEKLPNLRLWNFYGQTEMSPAACILPPEDQLEFAGSAGQPALNVEMAILDPASRELGPGQVGEIAFRSPHACAGYLDDPEGTERLFRDGWLHTGDQGYRSDAGRLYFVDRVKDTVNVGGEKVASREVEEIIYQMPQVQEAAVIGVPDPRFVEAVAAVVVPRPGAALTPDEVIAFTRHHLARFKTPKFVVLAETLPKNASGKILKRELRAQHSALALD
ncbi:MAG: AMP-binding protein [Bifidobacteriaceae bacterium]|nr:AMP-binding protein [Bifidobacteriaceae bacterium]